MATISQYLDPKLIAFLDGEARDEILAKLVKLVKASGKLHNEKVFLNAIINREKIVTTGIGMGVAIPHAKLPGFDDFFIVIAILKEGIDWKALDNAPVRIIFMIGGPDNKQTEYLQILSGLTTAIKDENRRKNLLRQEDPEGVVNLFEGY